MSCIVAYILAYLLAGTVFMAWTLERADQKDTPAAMSALVVAVVAALWPAVLVSALLKIKKRRS